MIVEKLVCDFCKKPIDTPVEGHPDIIGNPSDDIYIEFDPDVTHLHQQCWHQWAKEAINEAFEKVPILPTVKEEEA